MLKVTILPIVDPEDEWLLKARPFHLNVDGYFCTRVNGLYLALHHLVIDPPEYPDRTDHINQIKHDCRKENLRYATCVGNAINRPGTFAGNVRLLPSGRYNARVMYDGKRIGLGTFDTEAEALAARDKYVETLDVDSQYYAHNGQNSRNMELLKAQRL